MASRSVSTVIVGSRLLLREGLAHLIWKYSYRIIGSFDQSEDLPDDGYADGPPELTIICAPTAEQGLREAVLIRQKYQTSKVVLLLEQAEAVELHQLIESGVSGIMPLFASQEALAATLELVLRDEVRVLLTANPKREHATPAASDAPVNGVRSHAATPSPSLCETNGPIELAFSSESAEFSHASALAVESRFQCERADLSRHRKQPRLSEREGQILDSLVKGHANKVIARRCEITEATVKVHMKSILRKIQVANRTQAAIWALENGYTTDEVTERLTKAIE